MQELWVRAKGAWDDLRDSLWLLPAVGVALAVALAQLAIALEPLPDWFPEGAVFGGSSEGARATLSELAGATFTVVGLVFSLTLVVLQMASSQFTPRLLRTFLRDRRTQLVLSGMIASAVFDVAVLRTVRSSNDDQEAFVPALAISLALLFALGAVGLLIYYLHHLTQHMRVDIIMLEIRRETLNQIEALPAGRERLPDQEPPPLPDEARAVPAQRDGYLQTSEPEVIARRAREAGMIVRLRPTLGDWVSRGTTIAWVWSDGSEPKQAIDRDGSSQLIHGGLRLGTDRTEAADLAFGVRQLADIGIRAMSPGVNDPTTAVQSIEHLSGILGRLAAHPLGVDIANDDDGRPRVIAPRPTFAAHLALAIDQLRVYARQDPDVLVALVHLVVDLAELVADSGDRRQAVTTQLDRIEASLDLADAGDLARVERAIGTAREALREGRRPGTETEAS
jgi:uncharacterized membrane protein